MTIFEEEKIDDLLAKLVWEVYATGRRWTDLSVCWSVLLNEEILAKQTPFNDNLVCFPLPDCIVHIACQLDIDLEVARLSFKTENTSQRVFLTSRSVF